MHVLKLGEATLSNCKPGGGVVGYCEKKTHKKKHKQQNLDLEKNLIWRASSPWYFSEKRTFLTPHSPGRDYQVMLLAM